MPRSQAQKDLDHLVAELARARRDPAPFAYAAYLIELLDGDVERFLAASSTSSLREATRLGRIAYVRAACILVALEAVDPAAASPERLASGRKIARLTLDHCAPFATARMEACVEDALRPAAPPAQLLN